MLQDATFLRGASVILLPSQSVARHGASFVRPNGVRGRDKVPADGRVEVSPLELM
jgi:hypothetical protein